MRIALPLLFGVLALVVLVTTTGTPTAPAIAATGNAPVIAAGDSDPNATTDQVDPYLDMAPVVKVHCDVRCRAFLACDSSNLGARCGMHRHNACYCASCLGITDCWH